MAEGAAHLRRDRLHLLIHPRRPRWAALNPTGYQVARLCDGSRTAGQLASHIARRYGRAPELVRDDVARYVERLEQAGLLAGDGDLSTYPRPGLHGLRLHLNLSGRCNLRCVHCAVESVPAAAEVPTGLVLRLIDELADGGAEGIALSGGEPLLRDDCLAVLRYAVERLTKVTLSTNGALIDQRLAAELARLGVTVQVSIDGARPEVHDRVRGPGAFKRAWRGIEHLQRAGVGERLALCCTLMRPNLADVPRVVELAKRRGLAGLRFFPLQRVGRAAQAWAELGPTPGEYAQAYAYLYRSLSRPDAAVVPSAELSTSVDGGLTGFALDVPDGEMWCRLGRSLAVDAAGEIYPCSLLMAPPFRLGNVRGLSLAEALRSERLLDLLALCASRMDTIDACRACHWRAFCQAGCPGSVWWLKGTFHATDDLCDLRRRLYQAAVFERPRGGGSAAHNAGFVASSASNHI